jgi:1,4-alpha-glucan branching enzyme
MAATPVARETTFRTSAPNVHLVSAAAGARLSERPVLTWRPEPADALVQLGDGAWGRFHEVIDRDPHMFFVEGNADASRTRNPYARELTLVPAFPDCFCVLRDPTAHPWRDRAWHTSAFNDLIIYQLHVGTCCAQDESVRATRGGTFLDCILKLGWLRDHGINAVQLLPIQEFENALQPRL